MNDDGSEMLVPVDTSDHTQHQLVDVLSRVQRMEGYIAALELRIAECEGTRSKLEARIKALEGQLEQMRE